MTVMLSYEELETENEKLKNSVAVLTAQKDHIIREKETLENIFDGLTDAVLVVDDDYNVVRANRSALETFNLSTENTVGKKYYELLYAQDQPIEGCPLVATQKTLKPKSLEISLPNSRGTCTCSTALIVAARGKLQGYSLVLRDITESKRLERERERTHKMEAVSILSRSIAHELNELFMGVQGTASLALAEIDNRRPMSEKLKRIEGYIQRGHELTKQLLGFSAGSEYDTKPIDLNTLVEKSVKRFGSKIKDATIIKRLQAQAWWGQVDAGQIEQVLFNIYLNAWQAMEDAGEMNIETENVVFDEDYADFFGLDPGRYVRISVTDGGVGMDQTTQESVFEPFFTTKGSGTGLGLAFANRIVTNHGGIITLYSEKGYGTTVNVYLPAAGKTTLESDAGQDNILTGAETILLVDDEKMILEVAQEMLKELGYDVLAVGSGSEALDLYRNNQDKIELVILDMVMPAMGGGQVYDRLKEMNSDVKVLLASGYGVTSQITDILDRGCRGFMQKPFNMARLSQKIRSVLDEA